MKPGMPRGLAALLVLIPLLGGCAGAVEVPSTPPAPPQAQDRAQAARLYRDGLRSLNPPRGQPADTERAAARIEAAAALGDPDAQLMLGMSHLLRQDGGRDPAAAIPWLHRAAQQGSAEAQYRLARLIEAGEGTRREPAWAAVWFQRAAERGHAGAQFGLAMLQVAGEGTPRDEAEALARLAAAQRGGVTSARRYRDALAPRVPRAAAQQAAARIAGEQVRGPVPAVDRPLVRFTQSALASRSAWQGATDGRDGPQIRAALAEHARREGIRAAGPYDPAVIENLRAAVAPR